MMQAYHVEMELEKVSRVTFTMFGKDRDDVIAFAKKNYRKQKPKIVSVKRKKGDNTSGASDAAERTD